MFGVLGLVFLVSLGMMLYPKGQGYPNVWPMLYPKGDKVIPMYGRGMIFPKPGMRPHCGLLTRMLVFAIFNILFWVYTNFFHKKTDNSGEYSEVHHFCNSMIWKWPPRLLWCAKRYYSERPSSTNFSPNKDILPSSPYCNTHNWWAINSQSSQLQFEC